MKNGLPPVCSCSSRVASGGVGVVAVRLPGRERGDVRFVQPDERDAVEEILAAELNQQSRQIIAGLRLVVPPGGEDQQAALRRDPDNLPQQQQRRRVGPVQILDHQDERPNGGRRADEIDDGVEEPVPPALTVRTGRAGRRPDGELGQEPRQLRGWSGRGIRRVSQKVPQCLREGLIRPHGLLVRAAVENRRAVRMGLRSHACGEPRLPHAGLAPDEYQHSLAELGLRPPFAQPLHHWLAVDEGAALHPREQRRQGHRSRGVRRHARPRMPYTLRQLPAKAPNRGPRLGAELVS